MASSGIRDVSITLGSQIAAMVLGLASQSCLAWLLHPAGVGSYAICMVFITILNVLFVIGFDVAIVYYVASRQYSVSEGVLYTFLYGILSSALAIGAGLTAIQVGLNVHVPLLSDLLPQAVSGYLSSSVGKMLSNATIGQLYLALAIIPLGMVAGVLAQFPMALRRFGQGAVIAVLTLLIQLALTVLLVWVLHWGVEGALWSVIYTNMIILLVLLVLLRKYHGLTWVRPSWRRVAEAWSFGVRYYVGKISNLANTQIGTLIVAFFVNKTEDVGWFAVAAGLMVRAETIPNVLGTVILPRIAADDAGRPELVAQCARISAITSGLLLGILAIFTVPFVKVLCSPDFLPAVPLIRIIAIGTLIRCASKVVVPYLMARNRPGIASLAVFTGMGVNFGAMFLLLPLLGLAGAAIGMSLNYLVSSAILLVAFAWISKMPQREFWRFRKDDFSSLTAAIRRLRKKFAPSSPDDNGPGGGAEAGPSSSASGPLADTDTEVKL